MFDQPRKILRFACLIFGVILVCQLALLIKRGDPLNRLTIPQVPTLASAPETNSASKGPEKQGTNSTATKDSGKKGTNTLATGESGKGTNDAPTKASSKSGTNVTQELATGGTNSTSKQIEGKDEPKGTNATKTLEVEKPLNGPTNASAGEVKSESGTNSVSATVLTNGGTNVAAGRKNGKQGTNAPSGSGTNAVAGQEMARKGGPPGRPEPGKAAADLPPLIKARIERITQSEILGQVPRPMPMALLGIGDKDAFLRAPDGQTGAIKEGGELGGVKLLKIGTNRILIEHEGQKKELTLFSGLGSETLLPKTTEKTNETTKKTP